MQELRLIVRINPRAEPAQFGCQVPKAVDAASFPFTHEGQSLIGEICRVVNVCHDDVRHHCFAFRLGCQPASCDLT